MADSDQDLPKASTAQPEHTNTNNNTNNNNTHDHNKRPAQPFLKHLSLTCHRPEIAYGASCAAHCTMCFLFLILVLTFGSTFFPFFTNVPLYLRSDTARERLDAYVQGKTDADWTIGAPDVELSRTTARDAADVDLSLEIIYAVSGTGNILTPAHMARIREFELRIIQNSKYATYCQLDWARADNQPYHFFLIPAEQVYGNFSAGQNVTIAEFCTSWDSTTPPDVIKYCNSEFGKTNRVPCASPVSIATPCSRAVHNFSAAAPTTTTASCDEITSLPVGLYDCPLPNTHCTFAQGEPMSEARLQAKLEKYAAYASYYPTQPISFSRAKQFVFKIADSTFGGSSSSSRAVRSTFYFATPLAGFDTSAADNAEQADKIGKFMFNEYINTLLDANLDGIDVYFTGYKLQENFILKQLFRDALWVIASFAFVYLFMAYTTKSWWKSTMGMGQILMCFSTSYFLYYGVFGQRYFGVFNVLSIFIIVGIGADDIFVFLDTFHQSGLPEFGVEPTLCARMSWTWRRAAKAMLVTSSTTMASFLSNSTSSFPAISTFGLFASMLVFVNYCSVILYYPTVVAMYEKYFCNTKYWCGRQPFCCGVGHVFGRMHTNLEAAAKNTTPEEIRKQKAQEASGVERWFAEVYTPFVSRQKYWVFLLFAGVIALFVTKASQLEVDKEAPKFFPPSNNFGIVNDKKVEYFARGGSVYALTVVPTFGMVRENPIDRSGTSPSNSTDLGKPVYDPNFDLVKGLPCFLQICDAMRVKNSTLGLGGAPEYEVTCWAQAYRTYYIAKYGAAHFYSLIGANCAEDDTYNNPGPCWTNFVSNIRDFFLSDDGALLSKYQGSLFAQKCNNCSHFGAIPRFETAEVSLAVDFTIDFHDGLRLWHDVDEWFTNLGTTGNCSGNLGLNKHLPGWFTGQFWTIFFVQDVLVREAFAGIVTSLALAMLVLILATGNVYVGVLATFVISMIVVCVIGFAVMMGWKLGISETINFVMVPGMSVDYVAHLAEAYAQAHATTREARVRAMLSEVGISVLSGAATSLGAAFFLFFPLITFFVKFGAFIFATITLSLVWAMLFFPAMMALIGPQGDSGKWMLWLAFARDHFRDAHAKAQAQTKQENVGAIELTDTPAPDGDKPVNATA